MYVLRSGLFLAIFSVSLLTSLSAEAKQTMPRIVSREEWGVDEALGLVPEDHNEGTTTSDSKQDRTRRALTKREQECNELMKKYQQDFLTSAPVTHNSDGMRYVWPREESPVVKLIVLHHTGETETPETMKLSGIERVRAIYRSHTIANRWGDIGYNLLIDGNGVIYEGRAGGIRAVGAHAYCANAETVSIALIGNFSYHSPSESQLKSLRSLLIALSDAYGIDPNGTVTFHGKVVPTILGHRDISLNHTQCAGRNMQKFLSAIRTLVAMRDTTTALLPPDARESSSMVIAASKPKFIAPLAAISPTTLTLAPRGVADLRLIHTATSDTSAGSRIASIDRSDRSIGLWQQRRNGTFRIRDDVIAEEDIKARTPIEINLTILAPSTPGRYSVTIDTVTFKIDVGMRIGK